MDGFIELDSGDLSAGGAFLRSDFLFEEGEMLGLELPLAGGRTLSLTGRVVRTDRSEMGRAGMGIRFENLDDQARQSLLLGLMTLSATRS